LTDLGKLPVSCALDLIPSSLFFLEMMSTLEMMFGYFMYHLILHWNHYLCSQPLTGNSFTIDSLGNLSVSCALDLIPSLSFFGDDDYIGDDVWLLRISFNSTLESLPLLLAIVWQQVRH
jgi:hypothetical protein